MGYMVVKFGWLFFTSSLDAYPIYPLFMFLHTWHMVNENLYCKLHKVSCPKLRPKESQNDETNRTVK